MNILVESISRATKNNKFFASYLFRFKGMNIMIVTLITRAFPILSQLSEQILEYEMFLDLDLENVKEEPLDILTSYTPLARFIMITKSLDLSSVMMDIFFSCVEKVLSFIV